MQQSESLQEFKRAPDAGMMKEYNGKRQKKLGLFSNLFVCFGPDKPKYPASQAWAMLCFFTGENSAW